MNNSRESRAVFLDRDGVLNSPVIRNGRPYPPNSIEELSILDGVAEALRQLNAAGFLLIAITNQPDVARGTQSKATVEQIHSRLLSILLLDGIFTCYHDDGDSCDCRKPRPGLLLQASMKYFIRLDQSFVVGDRWRDIEAGYQAGCKTIFIDAKYQEPPPVHPPDLTVTSLREAVPWILKEAGSFSV